ncbi:helix-turn-helix domain-containing protein [Streptomyces avermitilis]
MRYPQGGGLTPERQVFRERIRMQAAERFGAGASNAEVAKDLRVSVRSVQRWRRGWQDAGTDGLRSAGPVSLPKLSEKRSNADINTNRETGNCPPVQHQ